MPTSRSSQQFVPTGLNENMARWETDNHELREMLAAAGNSILLADRALRLRRCNPAAAELLHISEADAGSRIDSLFKDPPDPNLVHDATAVLKGEALVERDLRGSNGRMFWRRITPCHRPSGQIGGVIVTIAEATSHTRRAANRSSRLKQGLSQLIAKAPDGLMIIDRHGVVVRANRHAEAVLGYRPGELEGQSVKALMPQLMEPPCTSSPNDLLVASDHLRSDPRLPLNAVRPDGRRLLVDVQLSPLELEGRILTVAALREIEERHREPTEQLQMAEIMQSAVAAIIVFDLEGIVRQWNRGAEEMFGYAAEEAISQHVELITPPDKAGEFERILTKLRRGDLVRDQETIRLHKDGTRIDVALSYAFVEDGAGRPVGVCAINRDIRQRREVEQRLAEIADQERQKIAEQLHDTLGQQISGISMLIASLRHRLSGEDRSAAILERIEAAIDQTKRQVRALCRGVFPVELDARGLHVALKQLAEETASTCEITCRLESPGDVLLQDSFVATQLFLVVREAVHNAVKHADGEIVIKLEDRDGIHVSVSDRGNGWPGSFDDTAGLGLRIMRHRMGLIGGTLSVKIRPDGGTIVDCHVPREHGHVAKTSCSSPTHRKGAGSRRSPHDSADRG